MGKAYKITRFQGGCNMNKRFSEKFSSQWIKVKFYHKDPSSNGIAHPKSIRFCEALKLAITKPIIVDEKNLSCESARHAFGWREKFDKDLLGKCKDKRNVNSKVLESLLLTVPRLNKPFSCIGLNTDDEPDLLMASICPKDMMEIVKIYNNRKGENLKLSLNSASGICSNVAVKSFLDGNINISFGCTDSRRYADIGRDRLTVGIPSRLFELFIKQGESTHANQ
jgi:uncharacterized protein (DUF169 family)